MTTGGDSFTYKGETYYVVPEKRVKDVSHACKGCAFQSKSVCTELPNCIRVIFITELEHITRKLIGVDAWNLE